MCEGDGTVTVEMQFLADVELPCEECNATRYKSTVLEIKYKGKASTMAKLLVVLGGSDAAPQGLRRIEKRFGHRERLENVAGGESVERFAGEAAHDFTEKNKAKVGVFHQLARLMDQRLAITRARTASSPGHLCKNRDAPAAPHHGA